MNNFDLRRYLIENKLTRNSRVLKESTKPQYSPQKAAKVANTDNPYSDRLLQAIDRIDSKYGLMERLILEVSFEQLKADFVDSGKLTQEVFDEIVDAAGGKKEVEMKDGKPEEKIVGGKSAYATWLAKKVADRVIKPNVIDSFKQYFSIFDRHRTEFEKQDLNQYKTKEDVSTLVTKAKKIARAITKDPSKEKGVSQEAKYKQYLIGTVDGFNVYKIPQGATNLYGMNCELGKGTEWCTATEKSKFHFNHYVEKGPLYVFIKPNSNEKYQFAYESHEFRDKDDKRLFW